MGKYLKNHILIVATAAFFSFLILFGVTSIYNKHFKVTNINNGKKLVIGVANDTMTLDPANTTEMDSIKVTVNIFETLVKYEKEGNYIAPCLAESWEASEDGLNFTFKLRKDVKFHDGTPFDAQAVVFNFNRWMDINHPYHNGSFGYWNYVFGGFPGFIKQVKALSTHVVQIKLKKPYGPFLSALAMPSFGIQSQEAIKKYGNSINNHPVGTGAFCFKRREPGKNVILVKNSAYWGDVAKLDEIEFKVISSSEDRMKQLEVGNINIADNLSPEVAELIESNPMLQLYLRPSFNVGYLAINNEKKPFDNRNIRTAVCMAIDKEGLIKEAFYNVAKPAKTLIPPTMWGYNESIEPSPYNPVQAKVLLKSAGFPNGFKTTLWVMKNSRSYFPSPMLAAAFIKKNLKAVHIDATIAVFDWDKYLKKMKNGEHSLALIGWTGDMMDPDNFLNTLLASENAKPGIAGNFSFYKNKEVDKLLSQARQNSNQVFRKSIYRKLLEIVDKDMPSVPLVHTMPVVATQLSVKGYVPGVTGVESLEKVDIE